MRQNERRQWITVVGQIDCLRKESQNVLLQELFTKYK